jgi:hypothetical protein
LVALARLGQSLSWQQPLDGAQKPLPAGVLAQNFWPPPQVHLLVVQATPVPQSAETLQQPAAPLETKPHCPWLQARAWQVAPPPGAGQSLASAQQPAPPLGPVGALLQTPTVHESAVQTLSSRQSMSPVQGTPACWVTMQLWLATSQVACMALPISPLNALVQSASTLQAMNSAEWVTPTGAGVPQPASSSIASAARRETKPIMKPPKATPA